MNSALTGHVISILRLKLVKYYSRITHSQPFNVLSRYSLSPENYLQVNGGHCNGP